MLSAECICSRLSLASLVSGHDYDVVNRLAGHLSEDNSPFVQVSRTVYNQFSMDQCSICQKKQWGSSTQGTRREGAYAKMVHFRILILKFYLQSNAGIGTLSRYS